jgi:tetratricopeptide (TPR) repeat protein
VARDRLIGIYYKLGQGEKAEKQIQELKRQSKPGDPGRQTLGLIYLRHGKIDESIAELDLIVAAFPKDYKSRYYLGTAYEEKENREKALHHFGLVGKESKYYVNAQMHIAYILESQKKYEEAVDVLRKTIEVKGGRAELYLMLASIYETKKEYGKAIEAIEMGLKQNDKNVDLIFRLGVVLDKSDEKEKCLEQMRRILEISPDHADALNYIGYTYAEQGIRLNEAMDLIKRALELKPNSGYIIDSLGWVYYQKGLYDEALSKLEKASSLTPNDPTISEHLGDVYFKKKKYQKSLEMYEKALSLNHPHEEKLKQKIEEVKKFLK